MSRCILTIFIFFMYTSCYAEVKYPFSSKTQEAQFTHLITELRCMVCHHQNLAESEAPLALDMKQVIYQKVSAGESDSEIRTFLTDRYGDVILFKPPFKIMTWFLWLAPVLFIILGIAVFYRHVRVEKQL